MVDSAARRSVPVVLAWVLAAGAAAAQVADEEEPLPRYLTEAEKAYLQQHPPQPNDEFTPPPTGPLVCPGEYAPMDGLMISWQGPSSFKAILAQIAKYATNEGDAHIYCYYALDGDKPAAETALANAGADMSRVTLLKAPLNSIWIRDYGPRYVYEGKTRVVVDHDYNRPRPADDKIPGAFAAYKGHTYYGIPIYHGGGNYHLNSLGESFATRLIVNENAGPPWPYDYTEQEIIDLWKAYQNVETTLYDGFPTNIDATQHIDMWMQVIGDKTVLINDYPLAQGSFHDQICEFAAADLASRGWDVHRIPALNVAGVHYTYSNMVVLNDIVLLPMYTNATASPYNAPALQAVQAAVPDKQVFQINSQAIVSSAGVLHCIVMHVPEHLGGLDPTVYVRYPAGGEQFQPFDPVIVEWNSDDDAGTTSVDVLYSTDGGQTWTTVAQGIDDTNAYYWPVPDENTSKARVRVVAYDAEGRSGHHDTADFTIGDGSACYADFDGSGALNLFDFLAYTNAFNAGSPAADCDANNALNLFDFLCFTNLFNQGC